MPTYEYVCDACGHREDRVLPMRLADSPAPCPVHDEAGEQLRCTGVMTRDVIASMKPHTDKGYQSPILSDALGIHPSQIPDAMRRFPDHRFTPDGRMILSSHQERNRVLKDLGMHDKA